MQKSVRYNEGHALYLALLARKEGTKRGYLSKKTAETSRWHEKWFALYQNVLFYFEGEQSARPAGMYMLEGCNCERVPAPKSCAAGSAKDAALDKQVPPRPRAAPGRGGGGAERPPRPRQRGGRAGGPGEGRGGRRGRRARRPGRSSAPAVGALGPPPLASLRESGGGRPPPAPRRGGPRRSRSARREQQQPLRKWQGPRLSRPV